MGLSYTEEFQSFYNYIKFNICYKSFIYSYVL